jgi:sodium/potassium/calcium exchanger 3/sodium/potassium/calcium exchanger 4
MTPSSTSWENVTGVCIPPAIEDFPRDFLTPLQRSHGGLVIHIIICAYTLMMIAIACDDYFVESLEGISSGSSRNKIL